MSFMIGCLLLAALFGGYLAWGVLGGGALQRPRRRVLQWAHALVGAAGLWALLIAHVPVAALSAMGMGGFRTGAAILLAFALLIGLITVAISWSGRRPATLLIGAHATIAITGITLALVMSALI